MLGTNTLHEGHNLCLKFYSLSTKLVNTESGQMDGVGEDGEGMKAGPSAWLQSSLPSF